jgi:hypothetical protein
MNGSINDSNGVTKKKKTILNKFIKVISNFKHHKNNKEPSEYKNLTLIRILGKELWTPDTFIYVITNKLFKLNQIISY